MPSFDIASKLDAQLLDNAVNVAKIRAGLKTHACSRGTHGLMARVSLAVMLISRGNHPYNNNMIEESYNN